MINNIHVKCLCIRDSKADLTNEMNGQKRKKIFQYDLCLWIYESAANYFIMEIIGVMPM
jgi:hypothetical protein